ncbi:hypothetical protein FMEAI12_5290027 [Parafrankia sp. Ea1.12]|nr:hypothetical protein FMEAI12_5290027 [Parafrankia sp. Ea1.12]
MVDGCRLPRRVLIFGLWVGSVGITAGVPAGTRVGDGLESRRIPWRTPRCGQGGGEAV